MCRFYHQFMVEDVRCLCSQISMMLGSFQQVCKGQCGGWTRFGREDGGSKYASSVLRWNLQDLWGQSWSHSNLLLDIAGMLDSWFVKARRLEAARCLLRFFNCDLDFRSAGNGRNLWICDFGVWSYQSIVRPDEVTSNLADRSEKR